MQNLAYQRCFNHELREAVARCPQCGQYFCRECITEHDDRVICAACLRALAGVPLLQQRGVRRVLRLSQLALGLLLAWFFFYLIGESLLALPDSFHQRPFWQTRSSDRE